MSKQTRFSTTTMTTTTTKRLLMRCIATLCVATAFLVRAEDVDAPIATQLAKLVANDGASNDFFGYSVAISNGIAVVGAWHDDSKIGSAYVFEMSSSDDATSWKQVAKLKANDGRHHVQFGKCVAISDGTIVIGSPYDGENGSIYIFEKSSSDDATSWTQVAKLKADDGAREERELVDASRETHCRRWSKLASIR